MAAENTGGIGQLGAHWTGPYGIHLDTVLYSAAVMLLCLLVFGMLGALVSVRPTREKVKRASTIELIVEFLQTTLDDLVGHGSGKWLWFIGSMFIFFLVANWLNLLPWQAWIISGGADKLGGLFHVNHTISYEAPTADLNTTAGLAILSLIMYWIAGFQAHGPLGFIGHHWFARPRWLFWSRMMEDITRPMSLALRLFANVFAGHLVGLIFFGMTLIGAAVLLPLELLVGAIQAYIFAALSASYIGAAVATEH